MSKHFPTRLLTLLLALLVCAPAAAQRIADLTPRSSIAEDDNFYCVADDASYQGVCDLQLIRSEIQERIHGANLQTGTTYELVLADAGKVVELANASPITLTIPANASVAFPVNTVIQVVQGGAGGVTINITSDTLNGSTSIGSQWDSLLLWKRAATEWVGIMPANTDSDAIHDNVSGEISAITEKATPVDADLLLIEDSAASNAKKRAQIGNVRGLNQSEVDARVVAGASGKQSKYIEVSSGLIKPITAGAVVNKAADANFKDPFSYIPFDGTSIEVASLFWKPPKKWNVGTISARFIWVASTNADALTVSWNLQAYAYSNGDDLSNEPSVGQQVVDSTTNDLKDLLISDETPALTIQGTPTAGDVLAIRVIRNPTADSYTADAWLRAIELFWTSNVLTDD